jgi:hypothetical protein
MDTHRVSGIPCPCPDTPHPDGDTVELRERLGLAAGVEIQATVRGLIGKPDAVIVAALVEAYVRHGIVAWTFVDDIGKAVPVTPENIQTWVLDDFTLATPVAEAADELYEDAVLGPLVRSAATSSPTTPTESSTSATDSGSDENPTPSSPSSTVSTPTGGTVTTLSPHAGGFKSLPIDPMAQLRDAG